MASIPVTQRAYTLRLQGKNPENTKDTKDTSWRDALWQTHEAVNKGAKVFGDWLLTLRGGLDHTLVDSKKQERKARRILLALSWLSVESKLGAPERYIIATGEEDAEARNSKVLAALKETLKGRGFDDTEIDKWEKDCAPSLSAAIREDAVWVNRGKAFDDEVKSMNCSISQEDVWDMLERFFGSRDAYLAPVKGFTDESLETEDEEREKDLVQKAGQWLSSRFGTGKGANFDRMKEVYENIAAWANNAQAGKSGKDAINELADTLKKFNPASQDIQGVLGLISGPGYKSATRNLLKSLDEKESVSKEDFKRLQETALKDARTCMKRVGSKGKRPYADAILKHVESACGFTYLHNNGPARHSEFAVMLDHAARRVSLAHTWIKRAEAERRRFEDDAEKIKQVPANVKQWLDDFCAKRSETFGALEPYRIRRRAIDGWKEVVAMWSKPDCKTREDRIAAARAMQDDPELDKFGDIQLFEALAEDDAVCVWHKNGDSSNDPDPQLLIDYVFASEADYKKRYFKVPMYRHPHPLLHPVFCDFGCSRWTIEFSIHEAFKKLETVKNAFEKKQKEVNRYKTSNKSQEKLQKTLTELKRANDELEYLQCLRKMKMKLFDGTTIKEQIFTWRSKRLANDLGLNKEKEKSKAAIVTRADRLGRAVSGVSPDQAVKIANIFEEKEWNGRLQAQRTELEAIAHHVGKYGWDEKAHKMCNNIKWLISFSARLQPQGPWNELAETLDINSRSWPHNEMNKKRKGHARLILSRLPGLRVLSVDLGHRYAAACAVWEAMSCDKIAEACRAAGHELPTERDLYLHLSTEGNSGKKRTTIYRRIGADRLPDNSVHPAPWARLDRQFLIKLQGEEKEAREASNEEIWAVHQMERALGRTVPLIDRLVAAGWGATDRQKARLEALNQLGWIPVMQDKPEGGETNEGEEEDGNVYKPSLSVDELMFTAVRTMRLALKRHGDRARIAHYLITDEKIKPGGIKEKLDENGRIALVQDALVLWHNLFSSYGWQDEAAKKLWDDYIVTLPGYTVSKEKGDDSSGSDRKKEKRDRFRDIAKELFKVFYLRQKLHNAWKLRWQEDDEQWKKHLRWFKDWILPRGKRASDPAIRRVGGLALTRLATLTEFRRRVQVGFFTRLRPDGIKAEVKEKFGQSVLDALEHLREQRVKQLASRIVEAALGIGSENLKHWDKGKRPRQPINDPRFAPCHAVVIENLTHYRPEETRTRRENRQLMSWASSKVKKYLAEECQLYGLHLREVSAGYTSRQDSRTGAPGIRCQDVSVLEFMRSPFWRQQVKRAERRQEEKKGNACDRFLCTLNAMWKDKPAADWAKAGIIRLPLNGGEIFVSADPNSPAAKGIQADLNAAANIGLRALTDPDWTGKWWYVPCDPVLYKPVKEKVEGCAVVNTDQPLQLFIQAKSEDPANGKGTRPKKSKGKSKEVVNLWRDISSLTLDDRTVTWQETLSYQNDVQSRVVSILEKQIENCISQPQNETVTDDVPF